MQYWLWSSTKESWEIVKNRRIWATYNRKICNIIKKGSIFIFYVKGTKSFKGIFQALGDWYETDEKIWADEIKEDKKKYPYQIDIQPLILGEANYTNLVPKLKFVERKRVPDIYLYLKGVHGAPVNF